MNFRSSNLFYESLYIHGCNKKGRDWLQQSILLYQKGLSKIYSVEKVRLLGMGEEIPLKKARNRRGREALMVPINTKEKNSKKVFLIVYFHLRFSILITTARKT